MNVSAILRVYKVAILSRGSNNDEIRSNISNLHRKYHAHTDHSICDEHLQRRLQANPFITIYHNFAKIPYLTK